MAETVPKQEMDFTEDKPYEDNEAAENTRISTNVSKRTEGPGQDKEWPSIRYIILKWLPNNAKSLESPVQNLLILNCRISHNNTQNKGLNGYTVTETVYYTIHTDLLHRICEILDEFVSGFWGCGRESEEGSFAQVDEEEEEGEEVAEGTEGQTEKRRRRQKEGGNGEKHEKRQEAQNVSERRKRKRKNSSGKYMLQWLQAESIHNPHRSMLIN